jgi:putative NADPH-quinone reductase
MKIIVINAAPRMETGNTQVVLNPFLVGLRQEGTQIDIVLLGKKNIKRCAGCFTCYVKTPGKCVHEDDMPALVERVRNADVLLLATPVYLDSMTSLAKTFIDRLVVFLDPHFTTDDQGFVHPLRWQFPKEMLLLSVCGYPGLHNFEPLLLHMERMARNFHSKFSGALLRPAIFSLLMTRKYPDRVSRVIDAIRKAGVEFAKFGRIPADTLNIVAEDICSPQELMETANAYWDRELNRLRNNE